MRAFFVGEDNPIGRTHPSTRIGLLVLACMAPLLVNSWPPMAALLAFYLMAAIATGAWRSLLRVKSLIVVFLVMSTGLWTFFKPLPGTPLLTIGPITATVESLLFGVAMGMRVLSFLALALIFLGTTRVEDIGYGLERLGVPYRLAFALSLSFRLTPLFLESAEQIAAAQKVRGLDLNEGGLVEKARRHVAIVVPVLISALRRADGLALALESKGFGAGHKRTSLVAHPVTRRDGLALSLLVTINLAALAYRWL
ncbi:MAG: energy-coupling factor transporter transmembrane protein EcfT [Deltaproteobacteria bacterium]|nr:energy-coupling factor transporter transmembrane protein EcfT [Deltaproteobacteria bacterium]